MIRDGRVGGAVLAREVRGDFLEEGHLSRDLKEAREKPHRYLGGQHMQRP